MYSRFRRNPSILRLLIFTFALFSIVGGFLFIAGIHFRWTEADEYCAYDVDETGQSICDVRWRVADICTYYGIWRKANFNVQNAPKKLHDFQDRRDMKGFDPNSNGGIRKVIRQQCSMGLGY